MTGNRKMYKLVSQAVKNTQIGLQLNKWCLTPLVTNMSKLRGQTSLKKRLTCLQIINVSGDR